ncbi:proline dehydrogenase family protein [Oceanidesulfovibrio marinus]|uniref:Proline dehydrogenase n=1 Tax=Oceanidesulfovibrio marinus TaxID=370038 RepID=A0A6P1ZNU8_9BACT|nr:proline dehydrogenase family protein [Oceanidesulfovibrio marinus]TVM36035.1 proline dehydrogenase [Oceanidesulfovibrio marinus]
MRLWQRSMIALARSRAVTEFMHGSRVVRPFSRRFVGGGNAAEAIETAQELAQRSIATSLFFLGEYVDSEELVRENVEALLQAVPAMAKAGLPLHVSVDPTQIGSMLSWSLCRENAFCIARAVADAAAAHPSAQARTPGPALMLDMEDASVNRETLVLYHDLRQEGLPAAVTIQSYLHRSMDDLKELAAGGAFVRLVKGAFAESPAIAHTVRSARDASYKTAVNLLFAPESRENGVYPALGTHDHAMIAYAAEVAAKNGWRRDQWEIEMLYGVRPAYQRRLVDEGFCLRLYLPFGRSWWPYSIRRIGETPRNLAFVLRATVGAGR